MRFHSILFERPDQRREVREPPPYFQDLALDRIVQAVTAGKEEYDLAPFFHSPLSDVEAIAYRQDVMRDFECDAAVRVVKIFAERMRSTRERLRQAQKLRCKQERERWFLGAAETYCSAVEGLRGGLSGLDLRSRGLRALRQFLDEHVRSPGFATLAEEIARVKGDLSAVRYCLVIDGSAIVVRPYRGETDYAAVVEETFEKFRTGAATRHEFKFRVWVGLNHVEAQVLDHVAQLNPEAFGALERFCSEHPSFMDPTISSFDREVEFYVAYLEFLRPLREAGLSFCHPRVTSSKEVSGHGVFDLALAKVLVEERRPVVPNDFCLRGRERILVVSGPNQGGKTTFARTFGQLHHLAALGCPVPGTDAQLFLFDRLLSHFEREEKVESMRGKLQDDLLRIRHILDEATPRSIVVMNEIFSSTTLRDAVFLSERILKRISELDLLCVCVTFLVELATLDEKTVSVVAAVDPANPAVRTYRLERRPADGLAYALAVAERYGVTHDQLKERIGA